MLALRGRTQGSGDPTANLTVMIYGEEEINDVIKWASDATEASCTLWPCMSNG
jgi:hypothetical protein